MYRIAIPTFGEAGISSPMLIRKMLTPVAGEQVFSTERPDRPGLSIVTGLTPSRGNNT